MTVVKWRRQMATVKKKISKVVSNSIKPSKQQVFVSRQKLHEFSATTLDRKPLVRRVFSSCIQLVFATTATLHSDQPTVKIDNAFSIQIIILYVVVVAAQQSTIRKEILLLVLLLIFRRGQHACLFTNLDQRKYCRFVYTAQIIDNSARGMQKSIRIVLFTTFYPFFTLHKHATNRRL